MLQMPLKPALAVRGTVAGHRLGAPKRGRGGGDTSPPSNAPLRSPPPPPPPPSASEPPGVASHNRPQVAELREEIVRLQRVLPDAEELAGEAKALRQELDDSQAEARRLQTRIAEVTADNARLQEELCSRQVCGCGGGGAEAGMHQKGTGPPKRPQMPLGWRLEEVAEAVGGGYCRLQMPLRPALEVRGPGGGRRAEDPTANSLAADGLVHMSVEELRERNKKTVLMAVLIVYALTEQREEEMPATVAWTISKHEIWQQCGYDVFCTTVAGRRLGTLEGGGGYNQTECHTGGYFTPFPMHLWGGGGGQAVSVVRSPCPRSSPPPDPMAVPCAQQQLCPSTGRCPPSCDVRGAWAPNSTTNLRWTRRPPARPSWPRGGSGRPQCRAAGSANSPSPSTETARLANGLMPGHPPPPQCGTFNVPHPPPPPGPLHPPHPLPIVSYSITSEAVAV